MRLFAAIDLSSEVLSNLERLIGQLRPNARIGWSRPENLHITTKFIGEWPEDRLEEVNATLRNLVSREAIPIEIRGLGWFPNPHSPRVLWAAVHAPQSLADLARETDKAVSRLGVPAEKRAYSPHLTLARIKEPVPLAPLRQAIAALRSAEFGAFTADRFYLYQSKLKPTGSVYTRLSEFVFSSR
jgi:2'-5' RNA ligase